MKSKNVFCPALLITAPASGHGKTSVTAGIARLYSRQGLKVRCFKTGPDFIDPTILAKASGQAVYNLDSWIMGREHCQQLLYEAASQSDLILVEGVMGLFDGEPSSADLAELFGLPIVPVIDASAMAQTFAAILHGLSTFRPSLNVLGSVANRVASPRHAELLKMNIQGNSALAILKRNADVSLPSRHLGLQLAEEISDIDQQLDLLADGLSNTWLAKLPEPVKFCISKGKSQTPVALLHNTTIAVARDRAFCFLYGQNLNCLRTLGANLVFFSPLEDKYLPEADAIYLPGGYPELYAKQLAKNLTLKKDIVDHAEKSKPILAECGGMLFLSEALVDCAGEQHKMLNIMPGIVTMKTKLTAIGSQQVLIEQQEIRGHTFHYSSLENSMPIISQANYADGRVGEAVYRLKSVTASYLHLYFPSNLPLTAKLFLSA
ncbi:MAG: cobyrinate a,c-diamide synthase [Methylococcaceae bacterium]|nr:cobyrinate a,c-diamide synthase [Methylococcaceae bacterium]